MSSTFSTLLSIISAELFQIAHSGGPSAPSSTIAKLAEALPVGAKVVYGDADSLMYVAKKTPTSDETEQCSGCELYKTSTEFSSRQTGLPACSHKCKECLNKQMIVYKTASTPAKLAPATKYVDHSPRSDGTMLVPMQSPTLFYSKVDGYPRIQHAIVDGILPEGCSFDLLLGDQYTSADQVTPGNFAATAGLKDLSSGGRIALLPFAGTQIRFTYAPNRRDFPFLRKINPDRNESPSHGADVFLQAGIPVASFQLMLNWLQLNVKDRLCWYNLATIDGDYAWFNGLQNMNFADFIRFDPEKMAYIRDSSFFAQDMHAAEGVGHFEIKISGSNKYLSLRAFGDCKQMNYACICGHTTA